MSPEAPYQLLPPLSPEEYEALKADIRQRGVLVPVEMDEEGQILDGYHRVQAWTELQAEGVDLPEFPRLVRFGLTEAEKRSHARALNLNRRHLSREQQRELIAQQLKDTPEWSDRKIASVFGVHNETVNAARKRLEATDGIRQLDRTVGADGKERPASRPPLIVVPGGAEPEPEPSLLDWAEESLPEPPPAPKDERFEECMEAVLTVIGEQATEGIQNALACPEVQRALEEGDPGKALSLAGVSRVNEEGQKSRPHSSQAATLPLTERVQHVFTSLQTIRELGVTAEQFVQHYRRFAFQWDEARESVRAVRDLLEEIDEVTYGATD